jgi:hypothetical protein
LTVTKILIPIVWAGFILWTVRTLWRTPEDPAQAKYDVGAKFLAVVTTVGCAATFPSILGYPALFPSACGLRTQSAVAFKQWIVDAL